MLVCWAASLPVTAHDDNDHEDHQAAQDVQGVEAGHGEIARRPHVAEGDGRRQVQMLLASVVRISSACSLTTSPTWAGVNGAGNWSGYRPAHNRPSMTFSSSRHPSVLAGYRLPR